MEPFVNATLGRYLCVGLPIDIDEPAGASAANNGRRAPWLPQALADLWAEQAATGSERLPHLPALCGTGRHFRALHRRALHRCGGLSGDDGHRFARSCLRAGSHRVRRNGNTHRSGGGRQPVPSQGGSRRGFSVVFESGIAGCCLVSKGLLAPSPDCRPVGLRAGDGEKARAAWDIRSQGSSSLGYTISPAWLAKARRRCIGSSARRPSFSSTMPGAWSLARCGKFSDAKPPAAASPKPLLCRRDAPGTRWSVQSAG